MPNAHYQSIEIRGAREHNLKNVDLSLPRGKLSVITGVSGSGKSSLAFDTLYAEGYRKYMESLSVKARQVLDKLKRPDVDYIHGLSPVIAIEQRSGGEGNARSTVATLTEIADYARVLWAVRGKRFSPHDGSPIIRRSLDDCLNRIFDEPSGSRLILLAPWLETKVSVLREEVTRLRQRGYERFRVNGEVLSVDEASRLKDFTGIVRAEIVIDRIVLRSDQRSRLADSLDLAFREGGNRAVVMIQDDKESPWTEFAVSQELTSEKTGMVYEALGPRHFSWNHPEGACPTCGGLGQTLQFRPELLVPDPSLSVRKGAIKPLRFGSKAMIIKHNALLRQLAEQLPFDPEKPWKDLPETTKDQILHGTGNRLFAFQFKRGKANLQTIPFDGVISILEDIRRNTSSDGLRNRLMAFQTASLCPDCKGSRLKAESRMVFVADKSIIDFFRMSIEEAKAFAQNELLPTEGKGPAGEAVNGLWMRLRFLEEVGLGYLTLDREYATLSGGESQRVRLATQLGMGLVGVTYVLDEPSIGLHPSDNHKLIETLKGLSGKGNTVVVVEHDAETMKAADFLVELGEGSGQHGGNIIFAGKPSETSNAESSISGPFLYAGRRLEAGGKRKRSPASWLEISGACEHNLNNINVRFPVGSLSVVCGLSGSGKSTLVNDILGKAAGVRFHRSKDFPGKHQKIEGWEHLNGYIKIDQNPIGRSPRSNPATFTKVFDLLREVYANCPLSRIRGYTAGRFSFNTVGGRCERCKGDGVIKLDMQFMPDTYVTCPSCNGKRYNRETLEVLYRGYSIADVLDFTVEQALEVFQKHPRLARKLETLCAVGLDYIHLGQPAPTLSGGEAQRLKLSLELSKSNLEPMLYILDEPTTGLHWIDIQKLMDLLFQLRDAGHTIIIIEHQTDVIHLADYVVELGPGGGVHGGNLVFSGPRDQFKNTLTSGYIA